MLIEHLDSFLSYPGAGNSIYFRKNHLWICFWSIQTPGGRLLHWKLKLFHHMQSGVVWLGTESVTGLSKYSWVRAGMYFTCSSSVHRWTLARKHMVNMYILYCKLNNGRYHQPTALLTDEEQFSVHWHEIACEQIPFSAAASTQWANMHEPHPDSV